MTETPGSSVPDTLCVCKPRTESELDNFWCVWMGYSTVLEKSYTYELYIGEDVPGEHSFTFEYGKRGTA